MKRLMLLLCGSGALLCAADLNTARTVYILSMTRGLDQYLANRLTSEHVLQVVTDPKLADVILTGQIGEGFQAKLESISPTPKPEKPEKPAPPAKDAKDAKADAEEPAATTNPFLMEPENGAAPVVGATSTFARNKGVIFLVDAKSRQVLWSVYEPPRGAASKELDHTATAIVARLKKDLKRK
jgi:hypothetical protein